MFDVFTLIRLLIRDECRCEDCLPLALALALAPSDWNIRRSSLLRPAVSSQLHNNYDQTHPALSLHHPRYHHHSSQ